MKQPWYHGRARRGGLLHIGNAEIGTLCGRRMRFTEPDEPLPTCQPCRRAAERTGGIIYLLHFDRPYQHASHYLGWTQSIYARLACHAKGSGAKLLRAVREAGIGWQVVAFYYGDRNEERRMKNHGHGRRCPACKDQRELLAMLDDLLATYVSAYEAAG